MNVLVTGSSGFVGKNLVAELKNKNYSVSEFDMSNGKNILDKEHVSKALRGIDTVIHLAAIVENDNPNIWKVNVEGTKILIDEAVKQRIKKFVFLSSTGVYGFTRSEVSEKTPVSPENIYEKSKVEAEHVVLNRQEEINVSVVRSAMVFGANIYWEKMFKMLKKKTPLPCNGKNTFQIIYVKDLVRALILVMKKGLAGEIYLISGKETHTLNDFCKEVKVLLGEKSKVKNMPQWLALLMGKIFRVKILTRENIRHLSKERKYNIEKIRALGFEQKYFLKKAIEETIEELKQINLD
jgi:UDP-glucose 4-epimerase